MADDDDYKVAISGEKDLIGFVLDKADFNNKTFLDVDFSKSKLKGADFSNSTIQNCNFREAETANTKFDKSDLRHSSFGGSCFNISFRGADLRFANFQRCLFSRCDFSNAIAIGTDFQHARFSDDCKFDNAIGDATTEFQNAQVLRPYSKLELFQHFEFKRGTLLRPQTDTAKKHSSEVQAARASIQTALSKIDVLELNGGVVEEPPQIGHNNPPHDFWISRDEVSNARDVLQKTDAELQEKGLDADTTIIKNAIDVSTRIIMSVSSYIGKQADTLISEFSRQAGATLGSKTALGATALLLSGELTSLVNVLRSIAGF